MGWQEVLRRRPHVALGEEKEAERLLRRRDPRVGLSVGSAGGLQEAERHEGELKVESKTAATLGTERGLDGLTGS